jgi:L-threonylcarbamoyladenylate synthase
MLRNKLSEVIEALQNGRVVVYPTDTLYAFGVDIYNDNAVRKVFKVKKRPLDIPIPVAVHNFNEMKKIAFVNYNAMVLAKHFLPGSLTLVLNKKNIVPDIVTSGLKKIAVRIPNNTIALELLANYGPLTVTSTNIHGMKTLCKIKDISMQFKDDDVSFYIDSGVLKGKPSTIIDVSSNEPEIIREGSIKKQDVLAVI